MKLMKLAIPILIVFITLFCDVSAAPVLDRESGGYSSWYVDNGGDSENSAVSGEYGATGVEARGTSGLYDALNGHVAGGKEPIYQGLSNDPLSSNSEAERGRAISSLKQTQQPQEVGAAQNQPKAKQSTYSEYATTESGHGGDMFWYVPSSPALTSGAAFVQNLPSSSLSMRANVWFCGWALADTGHISMGNSGDCGTVPSIASLISAGGSSVIDTPTGFQRTDISLISDTEMYLLIAGGIGFLVYLLRNRK